MIDPHTETPISLAQAARLKCLQRDGKPLAISTIWRWATNGVRGHKLETVRIGRAVCTSEQAINRLLAAINDRPEMAIPLNVRHEQISAAEASLDAIGVH